ncbi:MAG: adenosylcobinamide-GDP ribazoletransferase [Methylomicrobium sp.]
MIQAHAIHHFLLAVGFYTRLPCPRDLDYTQLPKACLYLPAIGWLVGGISAISFVLVDTLWSTPVAIIAALIAGIWTTGAFHEDGFADVCDGFGGGYGKQRILEIMKDSRIGAYGALGLILLILLKFAALTELPPAVLPWILLAGHSVSRWPPLYLMFRFDYARNEASKSSTAMFRPSVKALCWSALPALWVLMPLPPLLSVALLPVALSAIVLGRYFHRHIGGYTGDCLGACQQVGEVVFYLTSSALWTFI